jgi:hypothetical protein
MWLGIGIADIVFGAYLISAYANDPAEYSWISLWFGIILCCLGVAICSSKK